MNLPCMPWMDLMLLQTQRCHHLVWFLYGCVEREHILSLNACLRWWGGTFTPAAALTVEQGRPQGSRVIPGAWTPGRRRCTRT